jgi:nucleotide-binding universal stress UspA family protein
MRIMLAVDFSDVSRRMLDVVRLLPRGDALNVIVLHAAEPDPDFVGWEAGPGVVRDQIAAQFQRERREIEAMAEELRAEGIDAVGLVVQGPTVATILDEVKRRSIDLLVVGSHGHGTAYDLTVGSISNKVIRKSTIPVLVVPDR